MAFKYLDNIKLEEALEIVKNKIINCGFQEVNYDEQINVNKSLGRVTTHAVYANISSPHYNASAMDGIVLKASTTFGATDTTPVTLFEGMDFERVDTGDPLPINFDAVIMIEDVIELEDGKIRLHEAAVPWQHVRQIGEDICAGEMIVTSNTVIQPATIGAMLAGGVLVVNVKRHLLVGIIPTGDEIVPPTRNPKSGDIIEFNSSIFSAMLEQWQIKSKVYEIIPDNFENIKEALLKAAEECDVVLINAGSSAGREDYSAEAISECGEVFVHGIAIKPGKPTILGMIKNKPVIGVPGYPVSGIIVMQNVVKPILDWMRDSTSDVKNASEDNTTLSHKAVLTRKLASSLKYQEFVRVKLGNVDGKLTATPLNRGAGVVTSFVKADGILDIPQNSEGFEAGEQVEINMLRNLEEIKSTLVITGSHDPLIDEIADIMAIEYPNKYIASAHVGSMGGIMAVKRGEAHLAGIHLLDEETGEYNKSYVAKYFKDEDVRLVKGVKRIQGLMLLRNNPKKIYSIDDLTRDDISYVNRQKGSGTRILLDYLIKKQEVDIANIYGYDREEYTHMSVAAQIASRTADAGLGIYSAAKAFNLDFIPICEEEYDFIIPSRFLELELVQDFLKILNSNRFIEVLEKMGGYRR